MAARITHQNILSLLRYWATPRGMFYGKIIGGYSVTVGVFGFLNGVIDKAYGKTTQQQQAMDNGETIIEEGCQKYGMVYATIPLFLSFPGMSAGTYVAYILTHGKFPDS